MDTQTERKAASRDSFGGRIQGSLLNRALSVSIGRWRHGELPLHPVPIDQLLNQTARFRLLDKVLQEGSSERSIRFRPDRLLHGGELTRKNPRPRQTLHILQQSRPQPRQHLQPLFHKAIVRGVDTVRLHQFAPLDMISQPRPIGTAPINRDPIFRLVYFFD